MKVAIIFYEYLPYQNAGAFRLNSVISDFQKRGVDFDIYCSIKPKDKKHIKKSKQNYIYIETSNIAGGIIANVIAYIIFFMKTLFLFKRNEYDLIFVSSSKFFTAFLGSLLSRVSTAKLHIDVRDILSDSIKDLYPRMAFLYPFIKFLEKWTYFSAEKITINSPGFDDYFDEIGLKANLFTNGVDDLFLEQKYNQDVCTQNKLNITYAGNLGAGQGLHKFIPRLLGALDKVQGKQINFFVYGDGAYKDKLQQEINQKNIKNCILLEPVPQKQLIKIYDNSDILFMQLEDNEAFRKVIPSKIFEYLATGRPIIAGVSGVARKILNSFENVECYDPQSVNGAIEAFNRISLNYVGRFYDLKGWKRSNITKQFVSNILSDRD